MAETAPVPGVEALRGARLEELLAALAGSPGAIAAASTLTDTFASATGARVVLLYLLEDGERALRLVARTAAGESEPATAAVVRDDDRPQPLFAATMSLFVLAGDAGATGEPADDLAPGTWVLVPLPQPRLSWSSAPIDAAAAAVRAGAGWESFTPSHGERRGRVGLAPFGVAAVQLGVDGDAATVADALSTAATLAGPMLSRGFAVEQYRETAERLDRQRDLLSELIDTLPDPVLLTAAGAATRAPADVRLQNRRARRLFEPPEGADGDAAARGRRAADANARTLGALLAAAGTTAPHELTLSDPADGQELLFELCDHALHGGRLLVLRDVTALRRAGRAARAAGRARPPRRARGDARARPARPHPRLRRGPDRRDRHDGRRRGIEPAGGAAARRRRRRGRAPRREPARVHRVHSRARRRRPRAPRPPHADAPRNGKPAARGGGRRHRRRRVGVRGAL
jgi:hypothetical protein